MIFSISRSVSALVLLLLAPVISVSGLTQAQHQYFSHDDTHFRFTTDAGKYVLQFYNTDILEVSFYPDGISPGSYNESHAVVLQPDFPQVNVSESEDAITLSTKGIQVSYDVPRARFSFYYKNELLLQEHNGFTRNKNRYDDNHAWGEGDYEHVSANGYRVDFRISESEILMGGGARALGMNRRGHRLTLYNRAHYGYENRSELMNYTMPVVLSSKGYAIHFDNPTTGYLDLDSENDHTLGFEAHSGRKTYQIVAGETWEEIVGNYSRLTGLQPLPPRWALGSFSSRFGYRNQQEVLDTIAKFRELDVPVDAVIIDLYWFGQEMLGTMGNLAWDEEMWPDPKQMISDLEADGVKTVLITEPFVLTTSNRWEEAVEANALAVDSLGSPATWDFFFGNTGLIDVFRPEGKEWFWNIYRELMENYGVHGWWGDLGEPEVHPDWVQHYTGSAREVHNVFGHQWAKMVHEGFLNDFPDRRAFNLMRAGYSGSQRYGMIPWTGDVSRNWGGLKPQPEISLQMGLQGLAYMHSDLGGFAWPVEDAELYVRWMQYGVFQPVYRPHAQDDVPSEPVFWDDDTIRLSRDAINLRYKLMPYIYTAAFQNSQSGLPFMRPLFFEEPDNYRLFHVAETYLFGDDLLVTPVLRQGEHEVTVYAPATANWFDFNSGRKFEGGQTHRVRTLRDSIPVFVRGGAIIPKADLVQTLDDYSVSHLNLHWFYDADATEYSTALFHDDGETREAFERGMYEKLHLETATSYDDRFMSLLLTRETGDNFKASFSDITLHIRGMMQAPQTILLDGSPVEFEHDSASGIITVERFSMSNEEHEIQIQL